jgi:hypothetical protein
MTQRRQGFSVRENNRHGTSRDPVASTVSTGDATAPLESRRQRRALRGPKHLRTAAVSTVRDAWATPVVRSTRKRASTVKRDAAGNVRKVYRNSGYRDPLVNATRNVGGSTPCEYVYGTG